LDNKEKKNIDIRNIVTIILFGLLTLIVILLSFNEGALKNFCREDGPIEWAQAIFLLLASAVFFYNFLAAKNKRNIFSYIPLLLAIFLIFAFLEEVSYGQRVFGVNAPYYFQRHNVHREINIHNLMIFDSATEIGILSFYILWCLILPLILFIKKDWRNSAIERNIYIPTNTVSIFCLTGIILELYCRFHYPGYWANSNEILEIYLSLAIFTTALSSLKGRFT